MRRVIVPLIVAVAMWLPGCTGRVATLAKTADDGVNPGIAYSLPKTVLRVKVTYTVTETAETQHGAPVKSNALPRVTVAKPVTVTPIVIADPTATFVVSPSASSGNPFIESTFSYQLDGNGLLQGVDADLKDKTLETLQAVVSAGLGIAKLVALAGSPAVPDDLKPIVGRIKEIYAEIAAAKGPRAAETMEGLKKELGLLYSVVDEYVKHNGTQTTERDIEYTAVLDPCDTRKFRLEATECVATIQPALVAGVTAAGMPQVDVAIAVPEITRTAAQTSLGKFTTREDGVLYRAPVPLLTVVRVGSDKVEVFRDFITFPQFGALAVAETKSKALTNSRTILSFGAAGGLKDYKVDSGSSADKAAQALGASIGEVQKTLTDLRYNIKIDDLKKQKELLDAKESVQPKIQSQQQIDALLLEKQLAEAQLATEKAKKDLDDFRQKQ